MGQTEVLGWLVSRRVAGDHSFRSYKGVHVGMVGSGIGAGYRGVWWSVTCLHDQGLLEAQALGGVLSRRWVFRASDKAVLQVSGMNKVYNRYCKVVERSGRVVSERQVATGDASPPATVETASRDAEEKGVARG